MGKREIAKREVGLGLNISEFAKNAKTAEELLDKITEGRTVSLDTKLNLGDAQAVLQKILDQKTVSIRTALDVKDLMGIMEKSIADFEQRGSTSLARMNRRFLEEFQTGLGSVNFKLDDGSLIGGYQKAIEQANKLNLLSEKQGKIADEVAAKTRKQTAAVKEQTKATEQLAAAQKKVSKIKVREFTQEEYDAHTEKYEQDHDGSVEALENTLDIVRKASQFGTKFAADITTSCKRATTAVNRFFSAIDPEKYPALAGWKDDILESVQNGYFSEIEKYNGMSTGSYSWGVEEIGDGSGYYVYLNLLDVAKDKEKEYSAYLADEFKKRDDGLEKQGELTRRLIQTYEKLNELHANEPNFDNNNQIESIKKRLIYYEQEKVLLQDIQNIKEEFDSIPPRYKNPKEFNETARVFKSTLKFGDYGNGNLKDNERATSIYQRELERAIKKQEKLTAAVRETGQAREREADATEKATAAKTKYYEIDEKAAKLSKQMRSFDDYKEGSATASYKAAVDEMAKIVEEKKAQFPDQSDKLDQWLDKYAKNLATYINRDNQIGAQYPSVMISGAGNYNVNKHNRQMASWGKNYQYYDDNVLAIANKIKNLGSSGTNVIRSDESDALEKLEARLEYMKYWHDVMVEVNKYYRKNKTLEGFEGVEPDELERIKKDLATIKQVGMYDVPYPQYAISNYNQNIKRIEGRITELKRLKDNEGLKEENDIYKLWTDKQDMRIRISFKMGKPDQEIIDILRGKSFKWSPKNNAWQRQLTSNAVYDTKRLQESLHKYYQIDTSNTGVVQQQEQLTTSVQETAQARKQETEATQNNIANMKQLQSLIGDLKNKYGELFFNNIFGETIGSFGELNASNATGLYDALIAKNEEYQKSVEEQNKKMQAAGKELQTFMAQNQELANQYSTNLDFMNKYSELMNQISQSTLSATDATKQLNEYIGTSGYMPSLTSLDSYKSPYTDDEMKSMLRGIDIEKLLKSVNIGPEQRAIIQEEFRKLASITAELTEAENGTGFYISEDATRLNDLYAAQLEEVIKLIKKFGTEVQEKNRIYNDLYEDIRNHTIFPIGFNDSDKAEFGDDWNHIYSKYGKGYGLLKKDAPRIDSVWSELVGRYPGLLNSNIGQENDQLKEFIALCEKATAEGKSRSERVYSSLGEDHLRDIQEALVVETNKVVNNIETQIAKENELATATEKTIEAKRKQADASKQAQEAVSAEIIVERDIQKALAQLRSAKDNTTTLIDLRGVFSGDDLVEQFSSMVQKIAEQANLSIGKITVKDDIAQVRLYNEELKVTVDQMYQLKMATEEADSAQLELVSQSFSQNVKALNENTFDVDGFRARAVAAVEKVRSSLHGLEYDLTDLEKSAGNISSKEDFAKFNNQLKAAQDNIQAIKNATVSKSSMNQLANMQRDMKNANIELETMRIKLQKIGDIDGVEDAKKMIDDMALAAQKFNEAQDAQGQQDAYSKYSASRSSFKAQLEYLNAVKSFNASQASAAKQTVDPIKNQYKLILDTANKINSINSDILKFQEKDAGSGLYSGYIKQLQAGKEQLIAQLQSTIQEINDSLSDGFVQGKEISIPSIKFLDDNGAVSSFLNDTKTQAALTVEEIDKLVASLQKAQSIDVQAAAKVAEQFRSVQETYKQITSLSSLDINGSLYKGVENVFSQIMQYKNMLSTDPTQWTPEQSQNLQTLINKFNEYGNVLVQVGQKEAQYFAGKQKYTQDTSMQQMAEEAKKAAEEVSTAQQKLTTAVQKFAQESGASGAIVTNFVQGADGISRLDFSVLDTGTNSLRKFRMEMGSVTEGTYITETTVNNFVSKAQAAAKQLESVSDLIDRLKTSGANMDQGSVAKLVQLQKELNAELSKGDTADETVITKLTKDAKISQAEVEKLYKKHLQLQDAIVNGSAKDLGKIDLNGDIYKQLAKGIEVFAKVSDGTDVKIGKLNERTGQLKFTMNAADGTVREFTVSLDRLGKVAVAQETGVKELGSKWDQFKASLSGTAKQFMTAMVGANVFYKALAQIRKGYSYVKEIDLAMTELKKVTDETEAAYRKFLNTASQTAATIGSTVSDFTEATANFARLGYSMEEASKMAETAIVYKNVADGLDTVEESTESIISTMKAFGIESGNTMSIIDKFNEVGKCIAQIV